MLKGKTYGMSTYISPKQKTKSHTDLHEILVEFICTYKCCGVVSWFRYIQLGFPGSHATWMLHRVLEDSAEILPRWISKKSGRGTSHELSPSNHERQTIDSSVQLGQTHNPSYLRREDTVQMAGVSVAWSAVQVLSVNGQCSWTLLFVNWN